ncbi:hypothetical protein ACS0TY_009580 [Phlomoides rotata]
MVGQAGKDTDEVYAQITLMPEAEQTELRSPDNPIEEPHRSAVYSFCKVLTASDTSTHGVFSVLRKHANECLPPLTPTQELIAKDLHGTEWHFKHIFRGQPRMHLLTTGWSTFVTSKRFVAGDSFVFVREETRELRVGVRRHARQQSSMPSSVILSQSMHLGVLATASHVVLTQSFFVVYYKSRFSGTIVRVEDISPQWDNSKWRTLKGQKASIPTTLVQPPTFKHKSLRPHIEIPAPEPMASTTSPTWNLTHDAHKKNRAFERQRSIHMANSHAKQTDYRTTLLKHNNSSTLSTHIDGVWHSSLHVNAYPIMNGEEIEESKCVSAWFVISNHYAPSSGKQFNTPVFACTDVRQPDAFPSCRLFGFDLKSPSTISLKPVDISNNGVELYALNMLSSGDLEHKPCVTKDFRDPKQDHLQVVTKEVQSRHINSSRSRTKKGRVTADWRRMRSSGAGKEKNLIPQRKEGSSRLEENEIIRGRQGEKLISSKQQNLVVDPSFTL